MGMARSVFHQLYTIHGIVMGQLVPLMYCLLLSKKPRLCIVNCLNRLNVLLRTRVLNLKLSVILLRF